MKILKGVIWLAAACGLVGAAALLLAGRRSSGLRSSYEREVRALADARAVTPGPPVTDADLAPLPAPVQRYLRRVGVVGKPRVRSFRARFDAKMRSGRDARWMDASVEQHNFYAPPARLFFMRASRMGVPFDVFHRYVGDAAGMRVRAAGLITVVDASGPEMTQSETVTLLNDMCFLAPGALLDAPITWRAAGDRQVEATYANAGKTVRAVLSFDEQGDLRGFVSNDRYQIDAKTKQLLPWSTPVTAYRDVGGYHLPAEAEARWREPAGEWTYARFVLREIAYNVGW